MKHWYSIRRQVIKSIPVFWNKRKTKRKKEKQFEEEILQKRLHEYETYRHQKQRKEEEYHWKLQLEAEEHCTTLQLEEEEYQI